MRSIQMVDLKQQYHKIKSEVNMAVLDVLESSAFINGKPVQEFAANLSTYLGTRHTIPCANGTDALQIAIMALGLEPGDERSEEHTSELQSQSNLVCRLLLE